MAIAELSKQVALLPMSSNELCRLPTSDKLKLELLDGEVVMLVSLEW
jgi:hypothetical protein